MGCAPGLATIERSIEDDGIRVIIIPGDVELAIRPDKWLRPDRFAGTGWIVVRTGFCVGCTRTRIERTAKGLKALNTTSHLLGRHGLLGRTSDHPWSAHSHGVIPHLPRHTFAGKRFQSFSSPLTEMRLSAHECSNKVPWSACSSHSATRLCLTRLMPHFSQLRDVHECSERIWPIDRITQVARYTNRVRR